MQGSRGVNPKSEENMGGPQIFRLGLETYADGDDVYTDVSMVNRHI